MKQRTPHAFTLIELLVVVAIIALLLSLLMPGLSAARQQAQSVVCGSNIRQIALANVMYSTDTGGRYCAGASNMRTTNLHRWHGMRERAGQPFDPSRSPLVPYLTDDERIRACPAFHDVVESIGFETGNGGYGYNQAYLGRVLEPKSNGAFRVVSDDVGVQSTRVRKPAETLMFADSAFAAVAGGVIEYSFAEPRFHPEYLNYDARMDPSIHFRHRGRANIAWCDGHISRMKRTFSWKSVLYEGDPAAADIGWFGLTDDNSYFDLK